jgi:hypothetical protein
MIVADALQHGKPWVLEALAECLSEEEVEFISWDVGHAGEAAEAKERAAKKIGSGQQEWLRSSRLRVIGESSFKHTTCKDRQ